MAYNSLDSTFCKKCGTSLPADDVKIAKDKLEAVVADGFRIFNSGRTDEAMHIAETAVRANLASTAALSLKAMCHERLGQISEALECHERVLDIDPDSMIDKIKVNDLRNLLVSRSSIGSAPDRRMATVGAVAAAVLVLSIGVVLAKSVSHSGDEKVASNIKTNSLKSQQDTVQTPTNLNTNTNPLSQAGASGTVSGQPNQRPNPDNGTQGQPENTPQRNTAPAEHHDETRLPPGDNRSLPSPGQSNGFAPFTPNVPESVKGSTVTPTNSGPPIKDTSAFKDPTPELPNNTSSQNKANAPGIIDITIVNGHDKKPGDSNDPNTHPNGVEALLRTARSQYQIGNYSGAANSYERALRAGASPASGNQRLAQCYEKLGRNSEAAAAYNRAIDALQSQLNSGSGDKDRINTALDTCRQALKVLGG